MKPLVIILLGLCLGIFHGFGQNPMALIGATLLDVENQQVIPDGVVVVQGDRITAVGAKGKTKIPAGAEMIDVTGKYLIPGLVDAHIHLFQSGGIYTRPDALDLRKYRPYAEEQQWLKEHAADLLQRYLAGGITTVVDIGGPMANYPLRDSMNRLGETASVYLTGPLVSTYQPEAFQIEDAPIVKVDNAAEARELVRKQLPYKPDFIKIWYIARNEQMAKDNYPINKATIEEAEANGLGVAVHATQLETARLAVQAGAKFLVHSVEDKLVDADFIALLKRQGTVYCPTLTVGKNYSLTFLLRPDLDPVDFSRSNPQVIGDLFDMYHLPEAKERTEYLRANESAVMERLTQRDSVMAANLRTLQAAEIPIATGTDAGNIGTLHATSYYDELEAMQKAGLSNWEILTASTINGAAAVGKTADFGSLAPGKHADLVVLAANPLANLDNLQQIDFVMHRGRRYDPASLVVPNPEDLAQQQLNAYNARNIDAFLAPYGDEVEVYNFPDQFQYRGKDNMRQRYSGFFASATDLHCQLVNRIVLGNTVIDRELVTVKAGEAPFEAIAIYKIQEGKIVRVYFDRGE